MDHARLLSLVHYDMSSGVFTWKVNRKGRGARVGYRAGTVNSNGYRVIRIDAVNHRSGRLAWFYVHGEWPVHHIDHVDRDRLNDAWTNLREAHRAENNRNMRMRKDSSNPFKGLLRRGEKWLARINANGRHYHLGTFSTPEEAHAAYCKKADELHGAFACYG